MTNDISILEATTTTAPDTGNINNILQYTKYIDTQSFHIYT